MTMGLSSSLLSKMYARRIKGRLKLYSGTKPSTPDAAATGTLLATFEIDTSVVTTSSAASGTNLSSGSETVYLASGETWKATAVATGDAGYFRFVATSTDPCTESASYDRIDGTVGTTGADLILTSTSIVADTVYYLTEANIPFIYQYWV